jgi:hypothetical protein
LGQVFVCFLVFLSFVVSFLLLVSFGMWHLLSVLDLHVTDMGFWGCGDDREDEEEDGGRGEPHASHQVAGEELWGENSSHHYKATHLSEYVTGLGLSQLSITPSTRLKTLRWTASATTIQTDLTNHHLISFLLLCFVS